MDFDSNKSWQAASVQVLHTHGVLAGLESILLCNIVQHLPYVRANPKLRFTCFARNNTKPAQKSCNLVPGAKHCENPHDMATPLWAVASVAQYESRP